MAAPGEAPPSETRVDFGTLPVSQLDTYISYYELAPHFPPPLDPLPATLDSDEEEDDDDDEDEAEDETRRSRRNRSEQQQGDDSDGSPSSGGPSHRPTSAELVGLTRIERNKLRREAAEREAAFAEEQERKQRERAARERENQGLPPEQPLGRRAAAAAASSRLTSSISDPFGDSHDADPASKVEEGESRKRLAGEAGLEEDRVRMFYGSSAGATAGQQQQPQPAGPPPAAAPESFFDGEAANTYLSGVAGRHFQALPQPKEGEIVVGFLYKCRTKGEPCPLPKTMLSGAELTRARSTQTRFSRSHEPRQGVV